MTTLHADGFWDYSVARYGHPRVKTLCLRLQDEWGFNVNLLLFCGWLQTNELALQPENIASLLKVLVGSEAKIKAHRAQRKRLDRKSAKAREYLEIELSMEAVQQRILVLEAAKFPLQTVDSTCTSNLLRYFQRFPGASEADCYELEKLLT